MIREEKNHEIYLVPLGSIQFLEKRMKWAVLENGDIGGQYADFRYTNGLNPTVGLSKYANVILVRVYDDEKDYYYAELLTNTFLPKSGQMPNAETPKFLLKDNIWAPVMVHEGMSYWTRITSVSDLREEIAKLSDKNGSIETFTASFSNAVDISINTHYEMYNRIDETAYMLHSFMTNPSLEGKKLRRIIEQK